MNDIVISEILLYYNLIILIIYVVFCIFFPYYESIKNNIVFHWTYGFIKIVLSLIMFIFIFFYIICTRSKLLIKDISISVISSFLICYFAELIFLVKLFIKFKVFSNITIVDTLNKFGIFLQCFNILSIIFDILILILIIYLIIVSIYCKKKNNTRISPRNAVCL